MCIIAVSKRGVRQPSLETLAACFDNNPHGAGYMFARGGKVHIRKGFMNGDDFLDAVYHEHFTADDAVVYHCRIATQGGRGKGMTHPFPLSPKLTDMGYLRAECSIGIAHNGIISLTADPRSPYSDTALFVARYLPRIITCPADLRDHIALDDIRDIAGGRFALMDGGGYIATTGDWIETDDGLLFSNGTYVPRDYHWSWAM